MSLPSPYVQAYRKRYLPSLTLEQIAALPDKAWAPVIVVLGAIEQHGPQLPVAVDSFLGEAWVTLALERLPAGVSCYIAPPITIGKSNEHSGYPGTLAISKKTLRRLMLAIAEQVHAWGFRSLYVLHTHGGNFAPAGYTLREIEAKWGLHTQTLSVEKSTMVVSPQEKAFGYHANEAETALLLALKPQYVRADLSVCDYAGKITDPGELRAERAPATFSWVSQDLSKSGVMGDATAGTAEKGHAWLLGDGQGVADAIAKAYHERKRLHDAAG